MRDCRCKGLKKKKNDASYIVKRIVIHGTKHFTYQKKKKKMQLEFQILLPSGQPRENLVHKPVLHFGEN